MKTYHIAFDNDNDMRSAHSQIASDIRSVGGDLVLCSNGGFHLTKAILVVDIPDNTSIEQFTSLPAKLVSEDVPTVPVTTPETEAE